MLRKRPRSSLCLTLLEMPARRLPHESVVQLLGSSLTTSTRWVGFKRDVAVINLYSLGLHFDLSFLTFSLPVSFFCSLHPPQNSAKIIRASVFGLDEKGKVRDRFLFPNNNLVITSIDIQSVEPVDQRTRDALMKSVQLAIEITTNSQEAAAKYV